MKKQFIIVGIIVLLVCVGLSGCNENVLVGDLSPGEVRQHTDKYLGKTVTVRGYYSLGLILPSIDANNPNILTEAIQVQLPEGIKCYDSSQYRFTGVVVVGMFGYACLNATHVEPI